MNQPYVITRQKTGLSKHGGTVITISMIGASDRLEYKTYIDPQFFNYANWQHITANPNYGYVVRGLVIENRAKRIISADSKPILEETYINPEIILAELEALWKEIDNKPPTMFKELFD
jgi:hypothetical protein